MPNPSSLPAPAQAARPGHYWTLITNHAACLLLLDPDPSLSLRQIAELVQVTERSAARIIADLRKDGYVVVERVGRRNRYVVNWDAPARATVAEGIRVRDLLEGLRSQGPGRAG